MAQDKTANHDMVTSEQAASFLTSGGVIAYPTEAVMGLGCDPYQEQAVARVLALKQRPKAQGLICVAAEWAMFSHWVQPIEASRLREVLATWPGPVTWVFPASEQAPSAVCRADGTVAVRVSAHPVVISLCRAFGGAIVSTSANRRHENPCLTQQAVGALWPDDLDCVVTGALGGGGQVSKMREALTGKRLRV